VSRPLLPSSLVRRRRVGGRHRADVPFATNRQSRARGNDSPGQRQSCADRHGPNVVRAGAPDQRGPARASHTRQICRDAVVALAGSARTSFVNARHALFATLRYREWLVQLGGGTTTIQLQP
jgi:hypothetical protein